MAGYVIAEIEVIDAAGYEEYRKLAASAVAACGGRFLVRGGNVEALEGEWRPKRLVVLEFPSVEDAKAWWVSEAYRAARDLRARTAHTKLFVAEGVA